MCVHVERTRSKGVDYDPPGLAHSPNSPRPYSNSPAAWARLITAMSDVAREQRITNLIVRSQITRDPSRRPGS